MRRIALALLALLALGSPATARDKGDEVQAPRSSAGDGSSAQAP